MQKFINTLKCFFRFKHKPGEKGHYTDDTGKFVYKCKCEVCGTLLGLPSLSETYLKEFYPPPPLPRNVTDYKYT